MINHVLIANRGEIALRIIRTCKELDIKTTAIYTNADSNALHVKFADNAVPLFDENTKEGSYLDIEKIIQICKIHKVDAVHPGYGFLSENALFSKACRDNDVIFIGPKPETLSQLGNKTDTRRRAKKLGFPVVAGINTPITRYSWAKRIAKSIGYPVIIKAVLGGGGKGMRIVHSEEELDNAYKAAQREAEVSFGDNKLYIEKYVENPRHIEVQVLGDGKGHVVHLFERDCTLQRRHQKLIEEAGELILTPKESLKITKLAVKIAKSVDYAGAGTVEFLMDKERNFFFMEFNARIQVEYPVTEITTGVDLIKKQLEIGSTGKLDLEQGDIVKRGHAIECRLNAEDPKSGYLPVTGTIKNLHLPTGAGIRIDHAMYLDQLVSTNFDSMLGKIIVTAPTRKQAIKRLKIILDEIVISGLDATTIDLYKKIVDDKAFQSFDFDTSFLNSFEVTDDISEEEIELASIAAALIYKKHMSNQQGRPKSSKSEWKISSLKKALGL